MLISNISRSFMINNNIRKRKSGAQYRNDAKLKKDLDAKAKENCNLRNYFHSKTSNLATNPATNLETNLETNLSTSTGEEQSMTIIEPETAEEPPVSSTHPDMSESNSCVYVPAPDAATTKDDEYHLQDVGLWPKELSDKIRLDIVKRGPADIQNLKAEYPETLQERTEQGGKVIFRRFTKNWFYKLMPDGQQILRSWLVYSPAKNSIFCFCCKLFNAKSVGAFVDLGFNKWWKLNPKLGTHEDSAIHIELNFKWRQLEKGLIVTL